jgi:3-oxo-5-alpha-steroid 4-dehydrogenase 1
MISHGSFNIICLAWIGVAFIILPVVLNVPQPYGRHLKGNWGPMINNRIGWLLMELPALIVFGYFLSRGEGSFNKVVLVAAFLWGLHYINRVFIFPFLIKTSGKKIPVVIVIMAVFFNTVNGFLNGYGLSHFVPGNNTGLIIDLRLGAGIILFITGFAINKYHDWLLISLRSTPRNGYKIPFGGLFKYVSCPNFLGEIITWAGFFLVAFNLPALSFLIWTSVNLVARALDHHKWYLNKFPDYPHERKAIIPFLL